MFEGSKSGMVLPVINIQVLCLLNTRYHFYHFDTSLFKGPEIEKNVVTLPTNISSEVTKLQICVLFANNYLFFNKMW